MSRTRMHRPLACAAALLLSALASAAELTPESLVSLEALKPRGQFYEATVPDTLDLAERASLAINNLTQAPWDQIVSREALTQALAKGEPAPFVNIKQLRTLPKLRAMCGSDQNLGVECNAMRAQAAALIQAIHRKNDKALGEHRRLAPVIANWYERDGNKQWLECLKAIAGGVERSIIRRDDRAYFPTGAEKDQFIPYNPPDEPEVDQVGREGTVRWDQSWGLRAMVRNYQYNRDPASLAMADKMLRFLLKPGMWGFTNTLDPPGHEHGDFAGHFHGGLTGLHAMLDLAVATDNAWLKQFVWEAYNHARRTGVARLGWYSTWFPAGSFNRPIEQTSYCEACGIADLTVLAAKLSNAGLGDYWDDVDHFVRNQLTEQQYTDLDRLRKCAGNDPRFDPLLKRMWGGFGLAEPTVLSYCYVQYHPQVISGCCSPNAALALYYVWHSITRFNGGVATVNLLLNRASPWLDIDSYLPYEGKVVLKNKKARAALVRMPSWVRLDQVKCFVGDQPVQPALAGRCVNVLDLKPGDELRLEFPVPEFKDQTYTIFGKKYTLDFRGSTVVDIRPRPAHPDSYPIYQREAMRTATRAPMHKVRRFVADKLIPLP